MTCCHRLTPVNYQNPKSDLEFSCPPKTDILNKPALPDKARPFQFTAPIYKTSLPAAEFKRASVTVIWGRNSLLEFDQAGLLFLRPHANLPDPNPSNEGDAETHPRFVKIGPEVFMGRVFYAVTGSNRTAPDWSLWPMPEAFKTTSALTIEMVRHGALLAAFLLEEDGNHVRKTLIRTIPWCFEDIKGGDPDIWVGVYAARPDLDGSSDGAPLKVQFKGLEIETTEGLIKCPRCAI